MLRNTAYDYNIQTNHTFIINFKFIAYRTKSLNLVGGIISYMIFLASQGSYLVITFLT